MKKLDIDFRNLEYVDYFIAESDLIRKLCVSEDKKIDFNMFANLIFKPITSEDFREYTGFYIGINIPRDKLGFKNTDRPGDFDILIIPHSANKTFFNRTCAIEVKVVRPSRSNPKKSPSSSGYTQVKGLIQDGFPLVGLIHICMTEPLLDNEKNVIKFDLTPFDVDNPEKNINFMENTIDIKMDTFSWLSTENQMKRLITKDIPKYVGLCTIGVNIASDGSLITYFNQDFNTRYEAGYFNPYVKKETVESVDRFWNKNKNLFINAAK